MHLYGKLRIILFLVEILICATVIFTYLATKEDGKIIIERAVLDAQFNDTAKLEHKIEDLPMISNLPLNGSQNNELFFRHYRVVTGEKAVDKNKMKYILYWNKFYSRTDNFFGYGSEIFEGCPVSSCYATKNRSFLPAEDFDAIIFHAARWNSRSNPAPEKRKLNQKYIFFSLEPPPFTMYDSVHYENFYNWTLTYRRDSDIHCPYFMFINNATNVTITEQDLKSKNRTAMWMVSRCESRTRMAYAKELQKYIDVDIYGRCGPFNCGPFGHNDYCHELLKKYYYFYLAFENSQCDDYITEKTFVRMQFDVVSVSFAKVNFKNFVPDYTVIDVADFTSPKMLANYLMYLKDNINEYLKYFEWRKKYSIINAKKYAMCQLCDMLHRSLEYSSYDNVKKWYNGINCYN